MRDLLDRITYTFDLAELPMTLGRDRTARDRYAATFAQARMTPEVCAEVRSEGSNARSASPTGNMNLVRPEWSAFLEPLTVAAECAGGLREDLSALRGTSAEGVAISSIEPRYDVRPADGVASLHALLDELKLGGRRRPPRLTERASSATQTFRNGSVLIEILGEGPRASAGDLLTELDRVPTSLQDARRKLRFTQAIAASSSLEAARRRRPLSRARRMCKDSVRVLDRAGRRVAPGSTFWRLFSSAEKLRGSWLSLAQEARNHADTCASLEYELHTIEAVGARALEIHARHLAHIDRALQALDRVRMPVTGAGKARVRAHPLDFVIKPLLDPTSDLAPEALGRALCCWVTSVTPAGLAEIVQAKDDSIAAIAAAIAGSAPAVTAPTWGGARANAPAQVLTVLPPVAPEDLSALRSAFEVHATPQILLSASSAAAGITVVRLNVWHTRGEKDVFPPLYEFHRADTAPARAASRFRRNGSDVLEEVDAGNGSADGRNGGTR